jgi:hypothetical protein|tara:strand:- start:55 stop:246 length:192 start_codon:yes stop_codon:yes gene_type:complete
MASKNDERLEALTKQREQLEASMYKVMGAIELLQAIMIEDDEEAKKNKKAKGGSYSGSKKIKH